MSEGLERDDSKVLICRAVDKDDLWADVFGGGYEFLPWWRDVTFPNGDWETHGTAVVTVLDPDDPDEQETITKELTVTDLANAWSALTTSGFHHCGNNTLDDADACTSDAVLQQAVFGGIIYG